MPPVPAHSPPGRSSWLKHLSTLEVSQQSVTPRLSRGFYAGVSCVTIADGVGLSPFNMTALTAACLFPVANRLRHARPPCPFHVTTHALRRRYRPVAQVSWACGVQSIQSHHRPGRMDSKALHISANARVACTTGPRTTRASFLRTWLSRLGNMKHPGWLGVGYRLASRSLPSIIRQLKWFWLYCRSGLILHAASRGAAMAAASLRETRPLLP